jgi:cell pole-organizing protein PopZ
VEVNDERPADEPAGEEVGIAPASIAFPDTFVSIVAGWNFDPESAQDVLERLQEPTAAPADFPSTALVEPPALDEPTGLIAPDVRGESLAKIELHNAGEADAPEKFDEIAPVQEIAPAHEIEPAHEAAMAVEPQATPPLTSTPPTWEAAYYDDRPPFADTPTAVQAPTLAPTATSPATAAAATPVRNETKTSTLELPRTGKAFDCRSLAGAVRRLRPAGGRLAFVSVGEHAAATGVAEWSADLADELGVLTALPVERFAAGGLAIDGEIAGATPGYRLYFANAEFATARGAMLRPLDGVLLVVHEGATSIKAAEVVRGALAAQNVEFAGFVYVAR